MKKKIVIMARLLVKGLLFVAAAYLALFISLIIMNRYPWMHRFDDFIVAFSVSFALGVVYFFAGTNRELTLVFVEFTYVIYLASFVIALRSVKLITVPSALARCALGIINMTFIIVTVALLCGKRLGIIPARKHPDEQEKERGGDNV